MAPLVLIAFYDRPVLEGAGILILMIAVVHFADRAWDLASTALTVRSLTRSNQLFKNPIYRDFTDYLGEDLGKAFDLGSSIYSTDLDALVKNNDFSAKGERLPLGDCFLFQLLPREDGAHIGSFALNVAPSVTFVFTPYDPENLNASRLLALLHEFGHCSEMSWERRRSMWGAVAAASVIFIFSLNSLVAALACSFYALIGLYRDHYREKASRFWEELSADTITAGLFTRVMSTPELQEYTKKILKPKRKLVAPVDSQLNPLENYARAQLFVAAMRGSSENSEKADFLLDEVSKRHVQHSFGIAAVALSVGYFLFSFFEIGFANSFTLAMSLSLALVTLIFAVIVFMEGVIRSTEAFFEFHTSLGVNRKTIKKKLNNRELDLDVAGFMTSGVPLARALTGIQRFGRGTMRQKLQSEEVKSNAAIDKSPKCVRDLGLSVIEFMLSSPVFHGHREMELGRDAPPVEASDDEGTVLIEKWISLSESIGRYVTEEILRASDNIIDVIQSKQDQNVSDALVGESLRRFRRFLSYSCFISATIGVMNINYDLFRLKIFRGMRSELDEQFGDAHQDDVDLSISYESYVDNFVKFEKGADIELEEHIKPLLYLMYLLSDDEDFVGVFDESFKEVQEIYNKLLWTFSDVIEGVNEIGELMQKSKPDPEKFASAFLHEFTGEIK